MHDTIHRMNYMIEVLSAERDLWKHAAETVAVMPRIDMCTPEQLLEALESGGIPRQLLQPIYDYLDPAPAPEGE